MPLRHLSSHRRRGATSLDVHGQRRRAMSTVLTDLPGLTLPDPANAPRCFQLDRRTFLQLFGGGLLVCLSDAPGIAQESGRAFGGRQQVPSDISAWIHVAADNKISVFTGKVEVGQNIRTSLAQLVAEELMVPFDAITMVMGDTDLTPYDQGTFGSQSTPQMGPRLRTMAAAARQTLLDMAAKRWSCDAAALIVANGKITAPNANQSLTYGELTKGEKLVATVSGNAPLTPAKDWKIAGTPVLKANGRDFVTGKHQYPSDITLPGMMFGKVVRPQGYNATLDSIDTAAAEKMTGVKLVRDGDFIGVVAPDAWTAEQAFASIKSKWNVAAGQPSNQTIFDYLKANSNSNSEAPRGGSRAIAEAAPAAAAAPSPGDLSLAQSYTVQYIAHAPLEIGRAH